MANGSYQEDTRYKWTLGRSHPAHTHRRTCFWANEINNLFGQSRWLIDAEMQREKVFRKRLVTILHQWLVHPILLVGKQVRFVSRVSLFFLVTLVKTLVVQNRQSKLTLKTKCRRCPDLGTHIFCKVYLWLDRRNSRAYLNRPTISQNPGDKVTSSHQAGHLAKCFFRLD